MKLINKKISSPLWQVLTAITIFQTFAILHKPRLWYFRWRMLKYFAVLQPFLTFCFDIFLKLASLLCKAVSCSRVPGSSPSTHTHFMCVEAVCWAVPCENRVLCGLGLCWGGVEAAAPDGVVLGMATLKGSCTPFLLGDVSGSLTVLGARVFIWDTFCPNG